MYSYLVNRPSHTLNSNHLFLCDGKRAKVQGEFGEVAGVLPGQVDGNLVRIAGKLGRPHHHLKISSEELPYIQKAKNVSVFCHLKICRICE